MGRFHYAPFVDLRVFQAQSDVAANGVVDQVHGLRDIADLPLPSPERPANVLSIHANGSGGGLQNPQHQIDKSSLAGSRGADDTDGLAPADGQINLAQSGFARSAVRGLVGKRHSIKHHRFRQSHGRIRLAANGNVRP